MSGTRLLLKVRAWPEDGDPYLIECTARDVLLWEKTNKAGKVFQDMVQKQAMGDLYKIAHYAAVRQQLFAGDLKEFENTVDLENLDIDELDDAGGESVDPTQSAQ